MKINKYPDETSYANIRDQNFANFTFKINSYEDLWHLGQIIEVANYNGVKPTVTIPNLIDAQADRRFHKYESSGLKLVAKWLNSFDVLKYRIFHPHNPEVVEALIDNVEIIDNDRFITEVLCDLEQNYNVVMNYETFQTKRKLHLNTELFNNLILMSSDAGGFKPLIKLCDKLNWQGQTASASKSRLWNGKESRLVQQIQCEDFEGKDILIVDDICVYGGTFKGLAKMLRKRNCGKLYLAVSHMTVQNLGNDPVTNYFDKVFTANSKFDKYISKDDTDCYNELDNLEIIKMF